jgi:ABC-type transport system involved in cytochrome c biogenesis permease subunit
MHSLGNDYGAKLCILLRTTLELLHLLLRWHLSSASPWERLWSLFTFHLGGILALHSLRNDFEASLHSMV